MNGRSCSSSAVSDRGMESDSVFHNFLVCMELLLVLQAFLAIPNLNALPVHYAKQVPAALRMLPVLLRIFPPSPSFSFPSSLSSGKCE